MKHVPVNEQTIDLTLRWYKHFGIDHVFFDLSLIKKVSQNKAIHTSEPPKIESPVQSITKFQTLQELREYIFNSDFCFIKKTAKNTVFSDGDEKSDLMIIGEAPGFEEDEQGKPFVGQSGKLLNNMLLSIGLERKEVYISNVLFWRPPGNRTPSSEEIASCMPYVHEHIRLIAPRVLLLMGAVAAKSVLETNDSISKMRGKINEYKVKDSDNCIRAVATFHPAYLLRSPSQKYYSFLDMLRVKSLLNTTPTDTIVM